MHRRLAAILAADMVGFSRLMERGAEDVVVRQKAHRKDLIDPTIGVHGGNVVKTTGDGLLVEFATAQDAVACALAIQSEMPAREAHWPADDRIVYRIGINLGDIIFDDGDVFGDGVNVAARLETLAEPGGVAISDTVHQIVPPDEGALFRDLGHQRVKNISRQIRVWQWTPKMRPEPKRPDLALHQQVRFCQSADGTTIAWAEVGDGPPLLRAPHWLNHLEYEWQNPIFAPFLERLAGHHRLIRFDQRGTGLSDHDAPISQAAMIADMEAVVQAAGLERFAIMGISQGAAFGIDYSARHPDRVSALLLFGGYLRGRLKRNDPEEVRLYETARLMIREGWGLNSPLYRNFFTSAFLPESPLNEKNAFDELQRVSGDKNAAGAVYELNAQIDVSELARDITCPTLVLHTQGDGVVPLSEGHRIARTIPRADFTALPGDNHILTPGSPNFSAFFDTALPWLARHSD